jgi:hypothetical protein
MRTRVSSPGFFLAALAISALVGCDKGQTASTPPPETSAPATAPPTDVGDEEDEATDETETETAEAETEQPSAESTGAWAEDTGPVPVPEDPSEGLTEPTSFAQVKLEIKVPSGKVMRDGGKVIAWQQPTKIPFEFQGGMHQFVLDVTRDGKTANVELSYELDGVEVLRTYELETKMGKREVIRIEDGTALALTVTSKTIKPKSRAEREKIEQRKSKDPLSGVEKK